MGVAGLACAICRQEAQYVLIASPYTVTVCATHASEALAEAAVLGKAMALLARDDAGNGREA